MTGACVQWRPLFEAAEKGDQSEVQKLLERQGGLRAPCRAMPRRAHAAPRAPQSHFASLECTARVCPRRAPTRSDVAGRAEPCATGTPPSITDDKRGSTVLMAAAANSQAEVVDYLLKTFPDLRHPRDVVGWGAFGLPYACCSRSSFCRRADVGLLGRWCRPRLDSSAKPEGYQGAASGRGARGVL